MAEPCAPCRRAFPAEWQAPVGDSVKPSTRQNYADYIRAYVDPIIGDRRLQDVTVPVLNLLYRRLASTPHGLRCCASDGAEYHGVHGQDPQRPGHNEHENGPQGDP